MFNSIRLRALLASVLLLTLIVIAVRILQMNYTRGIVFSSVDEQMRTRAVCLDTIAQSLISNNSVIPIKPENSKDEPQPQDPNKSAIVIPAEFLECKILDYPLVFIWGIQSKNGALALGQNIPGKIPWIAIDFAGNNNFWTGNIAGDPYRIFHRELAGGETLFVGAPMASITQPMATFLYLNIAFGILFIIFVTISIWLIIGQIFKPLTNISKIAESIGKGQISSRISTHQIDIELRQVGLSLNTMLDRLENTIEAHARFNSEVSHELLAPLNRITTLLYEIAEDGSGGGSLGEKMNECLIAVKKTTNLACDLLELARSKSASAHTHTWIDLEPVVEEAVEDLDHLAREKDIQFDWKGSTVGALANPVQMKQVVYNLLNNAIKFAPSKSTIFITLKSTGNQAQISVLDSGPGVSPSEVEFLFKRFFRPQTCTPGGETGHGLGLAICKNILEQHQGTIAYERTPQGLTLFCVTLPTKP